MYNITFSQFFNPTISAFATLATLAIEQTHYNPEKYTDEEAKLATIERSESYMTDVYRLTNYSQAYQKMTIAGFVF